MFGSLTTFASGSIRIGLARGGRASLVTALAILAVGFLFPAGCSITKDREDAREVAARVHRQMLAGDFAAIYKESAPPFKNVGSESEFVSGLKEFQEQVGPLKTQKEVVYQTGIDSKIGRTHLMVFDLEFDHGRARESLMLVRSAGGKMELWRLDVQPVD
jgi:hypothetical protein